MPKSVLFEGETYRFPDDATEEEISTALEQHAPTKWEQTFKAIPGATKRSMAELGSAMVTVGGKVFGKPEWEEEAAQTRKYIEEESQLETPKNLSIPQEAVLSVGPSLAQAVPAALVGGVAAPFLGARVAAGAMTSDALRRTLLGGVTTGIGIPTGLTKFAETVDYGHSTGKAAFHGVLHGLIEKFTEYLPLKEFAKGGLMSFLRGMGHEVVGEELATLGQFINDKISTKPDATLGDLAHDLAVTAIATAISGPIQAGTVRATVAAMSPFIKKSELTTDQKATLDQALIAATSDGVPMPPMPADTLGAVTIPSMVRAVDIADLAMPDRHSAPQEGMQRVYTVVKNEATLGEHITWTPSLDKVQQMVDVMGPDVKIPFVDMTPADLEAAQKAEDVKKIRAAQAVDDGDFVLPTSYTTSGNYLYGKPLETQAVATPQAEATPGVETPSVTPPPAAPVKQPKPAKSTTPLRTLNIPRENKPKIKVEFEDEASKALYVHARHLGDNRIGISQDQIAQDRAKLAAAWGVPEDQVQAMAHFYREKVDAVVTNLDQDKANIKGFSVEAFRAEQARESLPEAKWRKEARGTGSWGEVVFSPSLQPTPHLIKVRAHLQKWLLRYAPDTKIMIVGEAVEGSTPQYIPNGNSGLILVPSEANWGTSGFLTLAHEFGHHLFFTRMSRAEFASAMAELRQEYEELVAEVPNMTVEQFIERWMHAGRYADRERLVKTIFRLDDSAQVKTAMGMPAQTIIEAIDAERFEGYTLSFEEYTAEQFARYLGSKRSTWFEGVVDAFKQAKAALEKFFNEIVVKIQPQAKFAQFVDHLTTVPPTEEGMLEDALNIRTTAVYMDLVNEQRKFTLKTIEKLPKKDKILRKTILDLIEQNLTPRTTMDNYGEKLWLKGGRFTDDFGDSIQLKEQRQDIKRQEYALFLRVLAEFEGDVIDRTTLLAKLEQAIIPMTTKMQQQWATYGLSNIGVYAPASAVSETFHVPMQVEQRNHFNNDRTLFGWVRHFADNEKTTYIVEIQSDWAQKVRDKGASVEDVKRRKQRLESVEDDQKSYLAIVRVLKEIFGSQEYIQGYIGPQKIAEAVGRADWSVRYNFMVDTTYHDMAYMAVQRLKYQDRQELLGQYPNDFKGVPGYSGLFMPSTLDGWGVLFHALDHPVTREYHELQVTEARVAYENAVLLSNAMERGFGPLEILPERWWEIMLRKVNQEASAKGTEKIRLATADTVAKVEGWTKFNQALFPELKDKVVVDRVSGERHTLTGAFNVSFVNGITISPEVEGGTLHHAERFLIQKTENERPVPLVSNSGYLTTQDVLNKVVSHYGRNQGIYDRYARDITKFVKKEFGAKEITEGAALAEGLSQSIAISRLQNNTWLEWNVKPNLDGIPVQYYDLVTSGANASGNVSNALQQELSTDLPDIPRWFERTQGFWQLSLKLSQMARSLPTVEPLQRYRRRMQEMANKKSSVMEFVNNRIKQWYSLSHHDSKGVMDMLETEVQGEVHWTRLEQATVTAEDGSQKVKWVHVATERVAQEAQQRKLSENAVALFMDLKNDYLTILGLQEETLLKALDHTFRNNPIVGSARKLATVKVFEKLRQEPYVPDRRFGQWSAIVKASEDTVFNGKQYKKGEKVWFSRHESRSARDVAVGQLRKQFGKSFKVTPNYIPDVVYSLRGLPREFVTNLPEALELTQEQMDKFQELSFDLTREGRYLRSFMKKKTRLAGMEQDMRRSYADHMWRSANAVAKMEFGWQLNVERRALHQLARKVDEAGGDPTSLQRLYEYITANYNYVMEPQHEWEQLRAITSLWYLWGVPKTALMNGSTIITTTYPHLGAKFGDVKATGSILKAMKDVVASWKNPSVLGNEEAAVLFQARADGTTNQSFAAEAAAVADGNAIENRLPQYEFLKNAQMKDRARTATWKLLHFGMLPFRVMEEFNRRATLLASYRLHKAAGLPGIATSHGEGSAYLAAKDSVDYTQNEYAPWDRAPFLRGKKSVALIFFSFMQHMSFFMFGGDKGWWRGMMMLWALAGLSGLPGAENIIDFANWLGKKLFDEPVDLRVEAREIIRGVGMNPDWVMYGAMHSMFGLGWDSSSSIGMGRIIPGTEAIFGQGDATNRLMQMSGEIFGPFGGLTVNLAKAMFDDNPNMQIRFERAAPTFARNLSRGIRAWQEDRWTDAQGRTLIDEATGLEVLGQTLGFQPTEKSLLQEKRHLQSEAAQFYALRRQHLLSALWQATEMRDSEAVGDVRMRIRAFNDGVPDPQLKISPSDIRASLRGRQRTARRLQEGVPERRYRPLYERIGETFPE